MKYIEIFEIGAFPGNLGALRPASGGEGRFATPIADIDPKKVKVVKIPASHKAGDLSIMILDNKYILGKEMQEGDLKMFGTNNCNPAAELGKRLN